MTTVIDPAGVPIPFFNRGGAAIVDVSPTYGGSSVAIPRYSGLTIARVTPTGSPGMGGIQVDLPSGADVGDIVEIHTAQTSAFVNPPAGESFFTGNSQDIAPQFQGRAFRKIDTSTWSYLA